MFDPKNFTTPSAKPLPVVLLLDVSLSMTGDKIESLNESVKEMLNNFAQEEKMETEIIISVITFGADVDLKIPFTKASQIEWENLDVSGATPMGAALEMAKAMIEDKETTPSRAYRPTIVLVSDGQPTDDWSNSLDNFISEGRSSKCDRMAMAIGQDADEAVLKRFIEDTPHELFSAENAGQLHEFFQRVTMSVTMRTQSKNPNEVPGSIEIEDSQSIAISSGDANSISMENEEKGYW